MLKNLVKSLIAAEMLLLAVSAATARDETGVWRVTFDTQWLGPVEAYVEIERNSNRLYGRSLSGATALLGELPGDHDVDNGLLVFEVFADDGGTFAGSFLAPWQEGELRIEIDGNELHGTVTGGAFAGTIAGRAADGPQRVRDYPQVLAAFDDVVASKLFAPDDLQQPGYVEFRRQLGDIAALARDDLDLLLGFQWAYHNDPFSHFQLRRSERSAEALFAHFDGYRVGFEAATVELAGTTAILKVRTMMGADTIEQIETAYERIAASGATVLIIDLRGNGGGAFAVKPLLEHVIDQPLDAGFFLSQVWNRGHDRLPTTAEVLAAVPWQGWSIVSFWRSVQEAEILRVRFLPAEPNFDGPVYVLLDGKSASATELAADAFRASGVATLVGERTAGEMLSQSMFDVRDGFIVSLPVADYYSLAQGRIEGRGVDVDIEAESARALEVAKDLAAD
jgi:carboxyl-terminal processing protease